MIFIQFTLKWRGYSKLLNLQDGKYKFTEN